MKKRFLLMTMVLAVGLGGSGCVLSGNRGFETITDAGISNAEKNDVSEEETLIVEETSEVVQETDESMEQEVSSDTTESSVASEESESPEETESVETTESNQEPATETTPEIPREEPAEVVTEPTTEEPEEEVFVAYDPNYVVALATEKTKAYGKILVWKNLDRLLPKGSITQEEYNAV